MPCRTAFFTVAALALGQATALAQAELKPPADFRLLRPITGVAELSCDFKDPEHALDSVAQGQEIELIVTIKSEAAGVKYRLTDAVQTRPEPLSLTDRSSHGIRLSGRPKLLPEDPNRAGTSFRQITEYALTLAVDPGAAPRPHDVQLTFSADGKRDEYRDITFFLAPRDVEREKYLNATATPAVPRVTAGADTTLSLTIANSFPTYRLTLRHISITSDPEDLIDHVSQPQTEAIVSGGTKRIALTVHGRHSLLRQLWPVDTKPKLLVSLKYDDGYRSEIERIPAIPIEFGLQANPAMTFLFGALSVLLGGYAGAWVRMTLPKAAGGEKGVSKWTRVIRAIVLSAFVVLAVVFMKIELISSALAVRVELYKPIATALISFVVGVSDPMRVIETIQDKFGFGTTKPVSGTQP